MVIDAHNHPDWHGHDLDRHLENMDRYGIDKCWILSWECPDDEYDPAAYNKAMMRLDKHGPIPFARCLSYAERARDRFVLGYAPDPRRPDAIDSLQAAVAIHGVQVYGELKLRMMFDNLDAMRMYRYCGEAGLPVTVPCLAVAETRVGSVACLAYAIGAAVVVGGPPNAAPARA